MYIGTAYGSYYNFLLNNAASLYSKNSTKVSSPIKTGLYKTNVYNINGIRSVQELKKASADMMDSIKEMTSGEPFAKQAAKSSDEEALAVSFSGGKYSNSNTGSFSVKIEAIAKGQENTGFELDADSQAGGSLNNIIEIETENKRVRLAVTLQEGGTNRDMQQKIAEAINSSGLGFSAFAEEDKNTLKSTLHISAGDEAEAFSVRDIHGTLIEKTGADSISAFASDALYSINGGETQSSKSNEISLAAGLKATLKKKSPDEVEVSFSMDKDNAVEKLGGFIDNFNKLLYTALSKDSTSLDGLYARLANAARSAKPALSSIGVDIGENGSLAINGEEALDAARDGRLSDFFSDENDPLSFPVKLSRTVGDSFVNTSKYLNKELFAEVNRNLVDFNTTFFDLFRWAPQKYNYTGVGMMMDFVV